MFIYGLWPEIKLYYYYYYNNTLSIIVKKKNLICQPYFMTAFLKLSVYAIVRIKLETCKLGVYQLSTWWHH